MDEYLIFLDETKPVKNQNPYFCIAGLILSKDEYVNKAIPSIINLKRKYFNTETIFHFTDMKKNKNEFTILKDGTNRSNFWNDYGNILRNLKITTIGTYFDQELMTSLYLKTSYNSYDISFISLLDNIVYYLHKNNRIGQICIESRTLKENFYLQNSYYDYLGMGSLYHTAQTVQNHLSTLGFIYKEDNCIGLQIADMVPLLLIRKIKQNKGFYGLGDIFYKALYHSGDSFEEIVGFKNIL